MTTRELEALQRGQLYNAGTLRFGRRRVRGMDADAREEPTEDGDRGDGEVVVTEGNDAERLAGLQERLELREHALERETAERTREQQEWKESADELENQLQASLREADNIRATMELEKLREVEALRRQFDREREQWRQDRDREWRRFDDERERLQRELRSEVERRERRLEEIQMEKVKVEERVRELESIVAMHVCGDSEGRKSMQVGGAQFLIRLEQGQTCQLTTGRALVHLTGHLHMGPHLSPPVNPLQIWIGHPPPPHLTVNPLGRHCQ